ncbi:MAG TPA: hypothetical protein VFP81_01610 [Propionibacteriaceae bacterium]|nr:hypothetical protein [Propionibacteriaceae bacterium]
MVHRSSSSALHRAVRITARSSAMLFAAAQATQALGPPAARAWRPLYLGFMAAHATHFTVVAKYAKLTGGRALFPGGRNLNDVGGWPTMAAIYALFAGLATTGWAAGASTATSSRRVGTAGRVATGIIGAMFAGTYLGQLPRSGWNAVPASIVAGAVLARLLTREKSLPGIREFTHHGILQDG